jgi:lysophospholipase L1-like esterase
MERAFSCAIAASFLVLFPLTAFAGAVAFGSSGPTITYVVLGDSTAAGVGGNYDSGIAISTARALATRNIVTMTNFAITGARIRDVRERQLPMAARLRPDLVLLSVAQTTSPIGRASVPCERASTRSCRS